MRVFRPLAWYGVVSVLAIGYLFPLGWMLVSSVRDPAETTDHLVPRTFRPGNYEEALHFGGDKAPDAPVARRIPFLRQLANTLVVALLGVTGMVLSSALAAYGFSRIEWPGRDAFFYVTVATMMIPFAVTMVPLYGLFRRLGWIGTLKPLWAPAWFGGAFNIFLLRQFFIRIPKELSEAARLDGCSEFDIFLRIILPLSKPALTVVALFHFMFVWNDFFAPLVFLTQPEHFTLTLGLHAFQAAHGGTPWHLMMAASTLLVTPVLVLYFCTQNLFTRGITMTGSKG